MTPSPETRVRALVARYLDARATWTLGDEDAARALREDPAARRIWGLAIATHRAMVGAEPGLPSGLEQRRQAAIAMARAGVASAPPKSWLASNWLRLAAPLLVAAAALFVATRPNDSEDWIRARGLSRMEMPAPRVGLGVGAVTEDGREYDAITGSAHLEDWLRFSYTNERADLGWLYVVAIQPTSTGIAVRAIAPLPEEGQSLPIKAGHFVPLTFETRLAARHSEGPVRLVALFTAAPFKVDVVERALALLDPSLTTALPSDFEASLREHLALAPGDIVQTLDTVILPGSAAPPTTPGPRQETP